MIDLVSPTPSPMCKTRLFGIDFDALDMAGAVEGIFQMIEGKRFACDYVVTPNTDHIVKLETDELFRQAYANASMITADGKPVVAASRILGKGLPGVVPGSDLVPAIFDEAEKSHRPVTVYLFGAGPGVADRAAEQIRKRWGAAVSIVGTMCPDLGFENDEAECARINQAISATRADMLVIGLGAPKQELWVSKHKAALKVGVALCVGATIDFLAEEKKRAPAIVQALALEWAYRIYQEPRRLAGRYAYDAITFPRIFLRELFKPSSSRASFISESPSGISGQQTGARNSDHFVYLACPWGSAGGGMYKVVDYLIQAQTRGGKQPRMVGLDARGNGSAAQSVLYLINALWNVTKGRVSGKLIGVHIHMAERLSVFRKGILLLFSRAIGLPVVLHLHAAQLPAFYDSQPGLIKALVRFIFNSCNHLIVLGTTSQAFARDALGVPQEKISIAINGVPAPATSKPSKVDGSPIEILFLGNLSERKGVSDLLNALTQLKTHRPDIEWKLNLAGGGDIDRYKQLGQEKSLSGRLSFHGWINQQQAAALLASADVLILPSYDEGLPLVILEALANSTAVICTPVGEIPSVLKDGQDALFVTPGNRDEIEAALARLATDRELRLRLGAQGHAAYQAQFSIDAFLARVLGIYGKVFKL